MSRTSRIYAAYTLALLAALACSSVNLNPSPDASAVGTSIAQTFIANLTETVAPNAATITAESPTFTYTPETPSFTPTQTLTPTPANTFTPLIPMVSVSVATNCRTGPGKVYPMVGALMTGVSAQVYGRDPTGKYWYIHNPDNQNNFCWIWGEYATLTGSISTLPILTPQPTPTPTRTPTPTATFTAKPAARFIAAFVDLRTCGGKRWTQFAVKNTGNFPFRSMSIIVQDAKKNVTAARTANGFAYVNACAWTSPIAVLHSGDATTISAAAFNYDLTNRNLRAWIVLCVQPNQGGTCVQRALNFKP